MLFNDNFFKRLESKTNVSKDMLMSLANKLQQNSLKDEKTLREIISELSTATGKNVSKEQEDKIVKAVVEDKVPKDLDKFVD
jgi:hypothetical protein